MKNLANLLTIKKSGAKHVVQTENGIMALSNGMRGVVSEIDSAILKEIFLEEPISATNLELFQTLKKVKVMKGDKAKTEKVVKQKS